MQATTCGHEGRQLHEFSERREPALWVTLWVNTDLPMYSRDVWQLRWSESSCI